MPENFSKVSDLKTAKIEKSVKKVVNVYNNDHYDLICIGCCTLLYKDSSASTLVYVKTAYLSTKN